MMGEELFWLMGIFRLVDVDHGAYGAKFALRFVGSCTRQNHAKDKFFCMRVTWIGKILKPWD